MPVPILLAASHPLGPVKEHVFEDFCDFVFSLELVKRLRKKLGPHIPLVMTLDLHANISDDLCNSANFICGCQTHGQTVR